MILGADVLAGELSSQINSQCPNREFDHGGQTFSLDLRTITGDVDMPQNNFKTAEFNPQGNERLLLQQSDLLKDSPNLEKYLTILSLGKF